MKYKKPKLEELNKLSHSSCKNGSFAKDIDDCTTGNGDTAGDCHNGEGATSSCSQGTGDIYGGCSDGASPAQWCVTGGNDS